MVKKTIKNPHAGEILKSEFLNELGLSQNELARALHVPPNRIHDIIRGKRTITADTDLRLCTFFGLSAGYFLRLQLSHDILKARQTLAHHTAKIVPYANAQRK